MTRVRLRLRLSKYRVAFEHLSKPVKTSDKNCTIAYPHIDSQGPDSTRIPSGCETHARRPFVLL